MTLPQTEDDAVRKARGASLAGDVTLVIVGDTNLQEHSHPEDAFRHALPVLHKVDARFGHLEGLLNTPRPTRTSPTSPTRTTGATPTRRW